MKNLYEILRVAPNATPKEINQAYLKMATPTIHPNRGGEVERMALVKEAYDVLCNPEQRHKYDMDWNAYSTRDHHKADLEPAKEQERLCGFLTDLHLQEQQKQKNDPTGYLINLIEMNSEGSLNELDNPEDIVNYITAFAIKALQTKPNISPQEPLFIQLTKEQSPIVKYIWTALMVIGMTLPQKFDEKSFKFGPNRHYQDNGLMYDFNPHAEMDITGRFNSNSFYETEFKKYLNKDRVIYFLSLGNTVLPEFLLDLYLKEQQKRKKKSADYDLNIASYESPVIAENFNHESHKTLINFTMAWAIRLGVKYSQPSTIFKLFVNIDENELNLKKYLWSCFIILSVTLPESCHEPINQHDSHDDNELQHETDSRVDIWTASLFGLNSLYSTEFKKYLNKKDVEYFLTFSPIKIAHTHKQKQDDISASLPCKGSIKTAHQKPLEPTFFNSNSATKKIHQSRTVEKQLLGKGSTATCSIPNELISEDKEEMFQLGQFHQVDHKGVKKNINLAFDYYLCAARLGHSEALTILDHLGDEMSAEKQLELSQLYEIFFQNDEKADYWRAKGMEAAQYNF